VEIYHVDPSTIVYRRDVTLLTPGDIDRQKVRLVKEGQIEPIEVYRTAGDRLRITTDAWHYAEAQVAAAVELGWDDFLVTY